MPINPEPPKLVIDSNAVGDRMCELVPFIGHFCIFQSASRKDLVAVAQIDGIRPVYSGGHTPSDYVHTYLDHPDFHGENQVHDFEPIGICETQEEAERICAQVIAQWHVDEYTRLTADMIAIPDRPNIRAESMSNLGFVWVSSVANWMIGDCQTQADVDILRQNLIQVIGDTGAWIKSDVLVAVSDQKPTGTVVDSLVTDYADASPINDPNDHQVIAGGAFKPLEIILTRSSPRQGVSTSLDITQMQINGMDVMNGVQAVRFDTGRDVLDQVTVTFTGRIILREEPVQD